METVIAPEQEVLTMLVAQPADRSLLADLDTPARARATVIFVHGLRTSGALWDEQVRALTTAGYPTRVVDLPGHGTRTGDRFTMERAQQVLDEAIADLTPGTEYVLVGLSLGGYTVLHHAARTSHASRRTESGPTSVATSVRTTSVSASPRATGPVGVPTPAGEVGAPGASATTAPTLIGVVAAACSSDPSTKPVLAYRDLTAGFTALGNRVRAQFNRPSDAEPPTGAQRLPWAVVTDALTALDSISSLNDLAQITVPVTLINGRWDHLRLEERRHHAARPGTHLVVIPGAKHDVSLEAPVQFNRALLTFLGSVSSRPPAPSSPGPLTPAEPLGATAFAAQA